MLLVHSTHPYASHQLYDYMFALSPNLSAVQHGSIAGYASIATVDLTEITRTQAEQRVLEA